jgi:hypothetical protein
MAQAEIVAVAAGPQALGGARSVDLEADIARELADLNSRVLRAIRERCAAVGRSGGVPDEADWPLAVTALRQVWRALPDATIARAASAPYLLIDAGLAHSRYWQQLTRGVGDGAAPTLLSAPAAGGPAACGPADSYAALPFDDALRARLARTVLVYAWHLSRTAPLRATLALGASVGTLDVLRAQSLPSMELLAERAAALLALRWADRPGIWGALLGAAGRDDAPALRSEQLKGLQRIAGACAAAETAWAAHVAEPSPEFD